jgi:hypothetical protein
VISESEYTKYVDLTATANPISGVILLGIKPVMMP